jgi:hypothetical protein
MSLWHVFKSDDLSTYPKVNSAMQVKYADGSLALGYTFDFFQRLRRCGNLRSSAGDTSKIILPNSAVPGTTASSVSSSLIAIA